MRDFIKGELTPLEKERNEKGVCINCGKFHTEPILDVKPVFVDDVPVSVEYTHEGYERLCELCDEILHNVWPIFDIPC